MAIRLLFPVALAGVVLLAALLPPALLLEVGLHFFVVAEISHGGAPANGAGRPGTRHRPSSPAPAAATGRRRRGSPPGTLPSAALAAPARPASRRPRRGWRWRMHSRLMVSRCSPSGASKMALIGAIEGGLVVAVERRRQGGRMALDGIWSLRAACGCFAPMSGDTSARKAVTCVLADGRQLVDRGRVGAALGPAERGAASSAARRPRTAGHARASRFGPSPRLTCNDPLGRLAIECAIEHRQIESW